MDIAAELAAFDGKHTDTLESMAARLSPEPSVIVELCRLARQDEATLQTAATWLLKRIDEDGGSFSGDQVDALLDLFDRVTHWEAKLHLLQMLPGIAIPAARKDALRQLFAGPGYLGDANKFVRAWSYGALADLATQHAEFRPAVAKILATGQLEDAASVRARIRNILKRAPWATSA